jgi:hypothetical protein
MYGGSEQEQNVDEADHTEVTLVFTKASLHQSNG